MYDRQRMTSPKSTFGLKAALAAGLALVALIANAGTEAPKPAATFTHTIYLVRHGAYDTRQQGDPEVVNGLVPLGIAQARLAGARLAGMPGAFDSLTTSPMTRARETAWVINQSLPGLNLQISPLLRECLPRTSDTETIQGVAPEELDACEAQLNQAFQTYFQPAKDRERRDLLICHGNVIRYLVTRAMGVDPRAWLALSVGHASLTVIRVYPSGAMQIVSVGDVGHLPPNLQSGTGTGDPELIVPTPLQQGISPN
jgi:serine/threonine-protein phosphatase PGAM5